MLLRVLVGVGVASLLLCGGCLTRLWILSDPRTQITIGPDTTSIEGPLTPEGYVDYEAALNERLSEGVTTDNNSVVLFVQAYGLGDVSEHYRQRYFQRLDVFPPSPNDNLLTTGDAFARMGQASDGIPAFQDQQQEAQRRPWSQREFPDIAAWIDWNTAALRLVREATLRPRYYSPVVTPDPQNPSLMTALLAIDQTHRESARLLTARAMLKLDSGDAAEAWDDLLTCHRLARRVGDSPFLVGGLIALAVEATVFEADEALLSSPQLTSEQARDCLSDLDAIGPLRLPEYQIDVAERFVALDIAQLIARGRLDLRSAQNPAAPTNEQRTMIGAIADWNEALRVINNYFDQIGEARRLPAYRERLATVRQLTLRQRRQPAGKPGDLVTLPAAGTPANRGALLRAAASGNRYQAGIIVGTDLFALLSPAFATAVAADTKAQARYDLLRIAFALTALQRDLGKYPQSLDELVPAALPGLSLDPFSELPFQYSATEGGFRLYSVGENMRDDRGRTQDDVPRCDDLLIEVVLE